MENENTSAKLQLTILFSQPGFVLNASEPFPVEKIIEAVKQLPCYKGAGISSSVDEKQKKFELPAGAKRWAV